MTAEIAIMNKMAVALAADSAATIGGKIFNSANKLFALSKQKPVGIMVYGNAEFLGVPWDTIVKQFRARYGSNGRSHIAEYGQEVLAFLSKGFDPSPDEEDLQVRGLIDSTLFSLRARIWRDSRRREMTEADYPVFFRESVADLANQASTLPDFDGRGEADAVRCAVRYAKHIEEAQNQAFGKLAQDEGPASALGTLSKWIFSKPISTLGDFSIHSGFVVAGFGEEDLFPALEAHELFGRENGQLLRVRGQQAAISFDEPAEIFPFAQREMAQTFLEGVNPTYAAFLESALERTFTDVYPGTAARALGDGPDSAERLKKGLEEIGQAVCKQMLADLLEHVRDQHVQPIRRAVAYLEREDLAAMAESLVNLTSLKQRFTLKAETVGGPVDVAIISKGDGFIWMKRKHYFRADLNPDFFARSKGPQL